MRRSVSNVNLSPDARIVDVGCGTGEFAPLFRTKGYTGIDIDPSNIAYAKRHYPGYRFDIGDALALPFDDASFDAALVVGVQHRLDRGLPPLAEIVGVVKPNAKALIMEDTESTRLVTRTMHNLDQGAFIRSKAEWTSMMEEFFTIGHLEKFFSPSRCESDSLTAMGHG